MTTDIIFAEPIDCWVEIEYKMKLSSIKFVKSEGYNKEKKTLDISFELERYFRGEKVEFSRDYDLSYLSPFVQKVLKETGKIGYGRTITYSELARKIGSSPRAVGGALGKNPVPIVIPCHRVVAKNGIGGYSSGVEIKTRLLELENL